MRARGTKESSDNSLEFVASEWTFFRGNEEVFLSDILRLFRKVLSGGKA
ncbi:hypothetical protein MPNT_350020 [Candidatus Methylacidithermus pantelleriae]|uniref:Uncharacterized protein n=1 Tax=Candidatus Methylacidithermus pantelleriae TaxID=2744239 RepID=A0A8J2BP39_9BACT|nr:hypothetical protein MPNT_350020 [Candidatus Methylacidithermus pantelleriae]